MFGIFAAVASVTAEVSGAVLANSVPVVGSLVVEGAKNVGSAVGAAVTSAGGSSIAGEIASGAARTAIHGATMEAAGELSDREVCSSCPGMHETCVFRAGTHRFSLFLQIFSKHFIFV